MQTQRRLAPVAALLSLAAVGLLVVGYLAGVSGLIRVGAASPTPSSKPTAMPTPTLQDVLERAQSAAVIIKASTLDGDLVGSGFVAGAGGTVLTNAHVVKHAFRLTAVDRDGNKYLARVIGLDDLHDVAALKVTGLARDPLVLATGSTKARVGTEIYVVGNPGGNHPNSVVKGSISATDRDYEVEGRDYHGLYQLDTSNVVGGSSGSPVITPDGQVVGIEALADNPNASTRFAYAIPVTTFHQQLDEWARAPVPLPVNVGDLPWQTDPKGAVVQLSELRGGYSRDREGSVTFSGTSKPPPSDEVTFLLAGSGGARGRSILSRVIVYTTRTDASTEVRRQQRQLADAGAVEQTSPQLGQESYAFTKTSTAETTAVTIIWVDRNVMCLLQFEGPSQETSLSTALGLASGVEQRVRTSPMLNPDSV